MPGIWSSPSGLVRRTLLLPFVTLLAACGSDVGSDGSMVSETSASGAGGAGVAGSVTIGGSLSFDTGGTGGSDGPECQRDVSLTAVTLGTPAPFDLVIVADHSQSLAWSRDELSTGLSSLLTDVRGRDVRVFLLTPTQYGASSAKARMPLSGDSLVNWQDPATHQPYTNEMTNFVQTCTDPAGAAMTCPDETALVAHKINGSWEFKMPSPIAVVRADMTDSEFRAQQKAVADAILAIGGTGSPSEQPLCTLARYIGQARQMLPKNAVFLLISDEDDQSMPRDCLSGYTAEIKADQSANTLTACDGSCDVYRYTADGDTDQLEFKVTCAAFDDTGRQIAGTEQELSAYQGAMSCQSSASGSCTADETKIVQTFCNEGKKVVSCQRNCTVGPAWCSVDLPDASVNACTQPFTQQGVKYQNLAAYCSALGFGRNFRNCQGNGYDLTTSSSSFSGNYSPMPLVAGATAADIGTYFRSHADAAFGRESYLVEAILLDPAFTCSLGAGQSYGTTLAGVVGDRKRLFPLCQPYAPALDGVLGFAQALVQTQFSFSIKADEHVSAVTVADKSGAERQLLATQYTYDRATQTLNVQPSALTANDSTLRVEVTSDCRPVIK